MTTFVHLWDCFHHKEKSFAREEELQYEILELRQKLKVAEYRGENEEMNIQRLNVRIDQVQMSPAVNIFSVLFASTFVYKTVSSTDNKRQQQNDLNDKTFTFIQFVSSRSTRSAKNWSRQAQPLPSSQVNENRLLV